MPRCLIGQAVDVDGSMIWDFYLRLDSKVEAFNGVKRITFADDEALSSFVDSRTSMVIHWEANGS
jgi:hypothetical protein